jgi:hypothetical protein
MPKVAAEVVVHGLGRPRLLQQLLGMRHDGGLLVLTVPEVLLPRVLCSGVWGSGPARRSRLAIEDGRRQRHLELVRAERAVVGLRLEGAQDDAGDHHHVLVGCRAAADPESTYASSHAAGVQQHDAVDRTEGVDIQREAHGAAVDGHLHTCDRSEMLQHSVAEASDPQLLDGEDKLEACVRSAI